MQRVEIRVKDQLDKKWEDWLDGLTITHTDQNESILTGSVQDQAALYGLMAKLRDLGVIIISGTYGESTPVWRRCASTRRKSWGKPVKRRL